jgi:hypothetical protein
MDYSSHPISLSSVAGNKPSCYATRNYRSLVLNSKTGKGHRDAHELD